jgi:nucleotide-binding universal stress UspA family protein
MGNMMKKLLCAIDGSYPSVRAVEIATEMAQALRVPIAFLTINPASERQAPEMQFWDERIIAAADAHLNKVLADAAAVARRAGLADFSCIVVDGLNISTAIVDYAGRKGFDHIIVGSYRPSIRFGARLGSVAVDVVKRAYCPVTVVR